MRLRLSRPGRVGVVALLLALNVLSLLGPGVVAEGKVAPVDVNTASIDKLIEVPGIGPATAKRIVEFRQKNGPFKRVDDLLKIRGIGEKSLEKLRPYLKVDAKRR